MLAVKNVMGILVVMLLLVVCSPSIQQPEINRESGTANERDTYLARVVWFPINYTVPENEEASVKSIELEKSFQKVSSWIEENEDKISSYTVDVVNATVLYPDANASVVVPSGVLITYIPKKGN